MKTTKTLFVILTIAAALAAFTSGCKKEDGGSGSRSSSSTSQKLTVSDVAGHWVGKDEGLTAMDINLYSNGSFTSSAGDFAGGSSSSGKWHITGNTVVIDYQDGGQSLLFSYKNGRLVASNGRALDRK